MCILYIPHLASLVVEPDEGVVPRQNLAVEGGVVLCRTAPGHRAADLDRFIQVDMSFLEWV